MYYLLYLLFIPSIAFCFDSTREGGEWRDSRDYVEVPIEEKETEEPPQEIILIPIRLEGRLRRLEEEIISLQGETEGAHTRVDGIREALDRHITEVVRLGIVSFRTEQGVLDARRNAWRFCVLNATISVIVGVVVYML